MVTALQIVRGQQRPCVLSWNFRADARTADQAESMLNPLQNSLDTCLRYVESITNSPIPVPFESELDELPSIKGLQAVVSRHDAIRGTYASSVVKILRLMDKSIQERTNKNGEALRRHAELSRRWAELQKRLSQLDTRVRLVKEAHESGEVEQLTSPVSDPMELYDHTPLRQVKPRPQASPARSPLAGSSSSLSSSLPRETAGLRSRVSSVSSVASHFKPPAPPAPSGPDSTVSPLVIKRRKSTLLDATSASAAKATERPPPLPSTSKSSPHVPTTPAARKVSRPVHTPSPAPAAIAPASPTASTKSGPGSPSRIPVLRTPPSQSGRSTPGPSSSVTPNPRRQSAYFTPSRPSLAPRPSTLPRPPAPPSSFRSYTPNTFNRPSSRLSTGSRAASAVYAPAVLKPFQPSKYDFLDLTVQSIIEEAGFTLLVSRLDEPLKRGQRRRDDEEWKGEFVFGAGYKSSSVKLLTLAARAGSLDKPRVKCLVRVGGAWSDLLSVLKKRQEEADVEELEVF